MALSSPIVLRNILFLKKPDAGFGGDRRGTRHDVGWKATVSVLISAMVDSQAATEGSRARQREIQEGSV